ncbi:MAG: DUF3179 domain-containing (seleno)protein [Pseudomonadota bacterium]
MILALVFWAAFAVFAGIGFVYFRDLGDVSQMVLRVKRENMLRFIRAEKRLLTIGGAAGGAALILNLLTGAGPGWAVWLGLILAAAFYGFPRVWVHLGLRNQQRTARYVPIEEARKWVNPSASVLVIENDGAARAHPDYELSRPHLAGSPEGLAGENVVMTYCGMANLGLAYIPEIDGAPVDLEVLAQHGNNLVLRDNATGEPIQQICGWRERDGPDGPRMRLWPTFRMSFSGFQRAYPEGEVFLNRPAGNLLLRLLDMGLDALFSVSLARHHRESRPVMDNMSRYDDRLPNKTYVWGATVGDAAACWTRDFVAERGVVNAELGGRRLVLAYDPLLDSLGAWWLPGEAPATRVDFRGESDQGPLQRVETLRPGMFWHVWFEFNPQTEVNPILDAEAAAA